MCKRQSQNVEVREKIISAAIEEFAASGYKAASTNSLCKRANVSKGLIYYYFKNKEEMYLNTLRYVIDKFKDNVKITIEGCERDGIDYISEYFDTKFKFFKDNPQYSKIIVNSLLNDTMDEVKKINKEFTTYNNELLYKIIKNIDINPKFDKEKAFELVVMIGEKLEEKHMKNIDNKNSDIVIEEFRKDHKLMIEMVFEGIDK